MCFMLYVGTEKPIPRKKWDKEIPDLCVESLSKEEEPIRAHFSKPEVQYVGSTSGCGCDFPNVPLEGSGHWPVYSIYNEDFNPELAAIWKYNREGLVNLLRLSKESGIEIYGIWAGDYHEPPEITEEISIEEILDTSFFFKEGGFYKVAL